MADDPFNLQRFVDAQANGVYEQALDVVHLSAVGGVESQPDGETLRPILQHAERVAEGYPDRREIHCSLGIFLMSAPGTPTRPALNEVRAPRSGGA